MSKPIISILIPVTKNEAKCLPDTLESLQKDIDRLGKPVEVIVIANACRGTSDEVAKKIFSQKTFHENSLISGVVINCETPGKMFAVNDGIKIAKGQYLLLIDGDLLMDPGSLAWTIDALNYPGTTVVSMHHTPIEKALPKDRLLSLVIQMNAIRRHTFPEKYWLHGAYLGWKKSLKIEGKPLMFPAGKRVHEDNWLTAIIARDYGFKTMRVTKNYFAKFIPPQNWDDYYNQQWRYQFAHEDLAKEFPGLAKFIPAIREWTNEKYPEKWIDREWRETCIARGIPFDEVIGDYQKVLERVRSGRENSRRLLDKNGVWIQQKSTKDNGYEKR